jgi:hypothetical protein
MDECIPGYTKYRFFVIQVRQKDPIMCHISKLGKYLFLKIASGWLTLKDFVTLDSAICCSTFRPTFLNYFETTQIVFNNFPDIKISKLCFMWQLKRKILMDKLSIDFQDFAWFDSILLFYGFWKSCELYSAIITQLATDLRTVLNRLRVVKNSLPSWSQIMNFQKNSNISSPKDRFGESWKHLSQLKFFNCA